MGRIKEEKEQSVLKIFLGLKAAEIIGVILFCVFLWFTGNLTCPVFNTPETVCDLEIIILNGFIVCMGLFVVFIILHVIIRKNWEWAERIAERR